MHLWDYRQACPLFGANAMTPMHIIWPLMPPLLRRIPPLPLLAFTGRRCAYPWFPAHIIDLDHVLVITCSAFIAERPPFVVTPSSIIVGRLEHTLPPSSGIIVDNFLAHPRLSARSRSRPSERNRSCPACDLVVVEYSDPCYRSRMACPNNIINQKLVFCLVGCLNKKSMFKIITENCRISLANTGGK